ncbi:hypothetical protein PUNSTDRAFT_134133 [Punctularia strigosozonata HHB-11173 SS5]|uniref:uncharacterized protein n=1 Tax=Punctularia strigosozonata (strain HHB-11173) TaxID=741275 RepID=UPI0004416E92|nr:uncharacterized protein PUNSTDRAFT_134133 [Punctularia strigosozonata HHB-11173 SS5]EIN08960.1 hypothetical protein PUNSTDRAFT_134133 [Punctularia strigosozonata HHB-11173 SS5]
MSSSHIARIFIRYPVDTLAIARYINPILIAVIILNEQFRVRAKERQASPSMQSAGQTHPARCDGLASSSPIAAVDPSSSVHDVRLVVVRYVLQILCTGL